MTIIKIEVRHFGHATFATSLNITGTSNITSSWGIEIVSITPDKTATNSGTKASPTTTWTGKVALMYPSDYGYASSSCYSNKNLNEYYDSTCRESNWLYPLDTSTTRTSMEWLLTPISSEWSMAFGMNSFGDVHDYYVCNYSIVVRPAVYLKSEKEIVADADHDGSSSKPYLLSE